MVVVEVVERCAGPVYGTSFAELCVGVLDLCGRAALREQLFLLLAAVLELRELKVPVVEGLSKYAVWFTGGLPTPVWCL